MTMTTTTTPPLKHLRVIDLSRVLAGPFCTQMLGDMGAEIIKIERPGAGDDTRKWGPPFLNDTNGNKTTESAYYLSANRNKKSVAIDISTSDGQALIKALLKDADIVIENFKTGGLKKYGLSYEDLKDDYPHLVYCSITGFGQTGDLATEPGYDFLAQAMSGLMSITGEPDGTPMKVGVALSDIMTGLHAAIGILAAIENRHKTGLGQHVDLALLDCTLSSLTNVAQYYLTSGKMAPRLGNAHSTIVPYQSFETKDGHVIIAVGNDRQFSRLCDGLGCNDIAADPLYATNSARVENRDALIKILQGRLLEHSTDHWVTLFQDIDVPVAPVNTLEDAFKMKQVQQRDMQITMHHDGAGHDIDLVGSPLKFSRSPVSYDAAPPTCGQHTKDILRDLLQKNDEEIAALEANNIIASS